MRFFKMNNHSWRHVDIFLSSNEKERNSSLYIFQICRILVWKVDHELLRAGYENGRGKKVLYATI